MGRKLDALLGRRRFFYSSKLKALLNLSLSRLSLLKNRCHVRYLYARSDVHQLLQLGHHESALLRVEIVLKEKNLFDVYVMIESYCNLLIEKSNLLERQRECPDELQEAVSGLLFASSRCGDFPELLQIRTVFASHFGEEFVARPLELRNKCSVNPMMIQNLSTKQQNLETKMSILKETASENSITLQLDEDSEVPSKELMQIKSIQGHEDENKQNAEEHKSGLENFSEKIADYEGYLSSMKTTKKYKDVADAAQAAFESAAYGAESEQSAVNFSRSDYKDPDEIRKFELKLDSRVTGDYDDDDGSTSCEVNQHEGSGELKFTGSSSGSDSEDDTNTSNKSINGKRNFDESDDDIPKINKTALVSIHKEIPTIFQS